MKIKQKANLITSILNKQYPETPVPLNHDDIYTLLIAVLLSAQCTDKRVNEVTPHLFSIADNPISMSKLSEKKIYSIIKPCGLGPKKSKAIKLLSKILVKDYEGEVPEDLNALENLPGVGHKTASVVMSQGFGHPAFPVDTHIHRLAQRWKLTNGKNVTQTEKDLKRIFPEESWNKLHLQIIFWGREFCQAHECFALECKICKAINPKRIRAFAHKRP
ncbi:MAG: endonuclease III [Gammaproteobacteria bacterium]|nr:endonuclease III [Marinovum sp.]OUV44473.1 MAG: endonuclease III [Rhodobacteraceae bacterium TMED111]|tara:strand:+ start:112 stop:765 length:654 start_codon:yes stop_codon:yes gene_type:complete